MIFVTVGAQMPFDRLIRTVDEWAQRNHRSDLFAQIGRGSYLPRAFPWTRFVTPAEYRQRCFDADSIVAHAGMGTIITALEFGKPIVVLPRCASLRETRNDHQFDTAARFRSLQCVTAAEDETDLLRKLASLEARTSQDRIASHASFTLLQTIRDFIRGDADQLAVPDGVLASIGGQDQNTSTTRKAA